LGSKSAGNQLSFICEKFLKEVRHNKIKPRRNVTGIRFLFINIIWANLKKAGYSFSGRVTFNKK
jgi:hypothetical protein